MMHRLVLIPNEEHSCVPLQNKRQSARAADNDNDNSLIKGHREVYTVARCNTKVEKHGMTSIRYFIASFLELITSVTVTTSQVTVTSHLFLCVMCTGTRLWLVASIDALLQ